MIWDGGMDRFRYCLDRVQIGCEKVSIEFSLG